MDPVSRVRQMLHPPPLQLVDGEQDRLPVAADLTAAQVTDAQQLLKRDTSKSPRWSWMGLNALTGPMMPGDLVVVGSLPGNGKSTLLMSQMDAFAQREMPTLYVPLEVDPEVCRLRWAAWKLGLAQKHVIRQEWDMLPRDAAGAVDLTLEEQKHEPFVHFAPPRRMTLAQVEKWCKWAREEFDAKVVMLDHLHRLDFGGTQNYRVSATDVIRRIKDLARELGVVIIAAAQLNRSTDPIDPFVVPVMARFKETAAIGEEADVVLMLSRKLRRDLPDNWQKDLHTNRINEWELAEANVMVATCRKHRLDDSALNGRVLLSVENGRIVGSNV